MRLDVKENDAVSVSFPIVPIKLGKVSIKVMVAAEITGEEMLAGQPVGSDAVVRSILVVVRVVKFYCPFVWPQCLKKMLASNASNTSNSLLFYSIFK